MFQAIVAALRFAGPAAIGYFINDVFGAVSKFWTSLNPFTTDGEGNDVVKPILAVVYFIVAGLLIVIVIGFLQGKKSLKKILMGISIAGIFYSWIHPSLAGVHEYAQVLFTLTTGSAILTQQNSTYVPKYFWYTAATQLTEVKLTVQGDGVVFDIDSNGLSQIGVIRLLGNVTNTYLYRLANGLVPQKNVVWEITNSAAQTPNIYVSTDQSQPKGSLVYLQAIRQPIVGPGGTDITNFATLSLPSLAAADYINILYSDGTQQSNMTRADIQSMLQLSQNVVNTPVYVIDNYGKRIVKASCQVGTTQTGYIQRWVQPVPNGMISQAPVARG